MTPPQREQRPADGDITPAEFDYIRGLTREQTSVVLDANKTYLLKSRLLPLVRESGFDSIGSLVRHLKTHPVGDLHMSTVEAVINTETSFFREFRLFEVLRTIIIPELVRERRRTTRSIGIWSAACSSGQEPHSIAMMLRDNFAQALDGWNLRLLASDVSSEMVARAEAGLYGHHEVNRGLPARLLVKYFERTATGWKLNDDLVHMFRYFRHDVTRDVPDIAPVDVLLLRNALLYFDVETRKSVLCKLKRALRSKGYLVLGATETTLNLDVGFTRVQFGRTTCYRVERSGTQ